MWCPIIYEVSENERDKYQNFACCLVADAQIFLTKINFPELRISQQKEATIMILVDYCKQ